jgi:hypothetical protein
VFTRALQELLDRREAEIRAKVRAVKTGFLFSCRVFMRGYRLKRTRGGRGRRKIVCSKSSSGSFCSSKVRYSKLQHRLLV